LALSKPVTASSAAWSKAEYAVDGNEYQGSRWTSNFPLDGNQDHEQWLFVDLLQRYEIDKVRILWQRQRWAKNYQIQVSNDAKNWTTVYSVIDAEPQQWRHELQFEAEEARYVRLYCTKTAESQRERKDLAKHLNMYAVIELEVYAKGKAFDNSRFVSSATGKAVVASYSEDNMYRRPEQINDALMTTFWAVDTNLESPWIYIDLEKKQKIRDLTLYWHRVPSGYIIEVSNDAKQWRNIGSESRMSVETIDDEEVKEIHQQSFSGYQEGRYVRVAIKSLTAKDLQMSSYILQEFLINF